MKCGRICLSHGGQLPVLHRRKGSQHFMNQAKFHSTFPILLLLKSLLGCVFLFLIETLDLNLYFWVQFTKKETSKWRVSLRI